MTGWKTGNIDNSPLPSITILLMEALPPGLPVPPDLHERLTIQALLEGDSLNNYLEKILEKAV